MRGVVLWWYLCVLWWYTEWRRAGHLGVCRGSSPLHGCASDRCSRSRSWAARSHMPRAPFPGGIPVQVAPSSDELSSHCVGFCKEFEVESASAQQAQQAQQASQQHANGASALDVPASAAASTEPSPRTPVAPDVRPQARCYGLATAAGAGAEAGGKATVPLVCAHVLHALPTWRLLLLQAQHLVASEAPLRRASTFSTGPRALMVFRGCPRPLGSTIVLRGSDAAGKHG